MLSSSSAMRAGSWAPCLAASAAVDGAAALVAEHDEQRRAQMHSRVLQRPHHLGRDHVARDPNDEQLAEAGVEDQFRRHPGIAAPEDGRVRALALGERGEDLLLNGREARFASDETLVAGDQTRERLVGRVGGRRVHAHRRRSSLDIVEGFDRNACGSFSGGKSGLLMIVRISVSLSTTLSLSEFQAGNMLLGEPLDGAGKRLSGNWAQRRPGP